MKISHHVAATLKGEFFVNAVIYNIDTCFSLRRIHPGKGVTCFPVTVGGN